MFAASYFGKFLDVPNVATSLQILHNLFYRFVDVKGGGNEIFFEIAGELVSYSLRDFGMITGLNYVGDTDYRHQVKSERSEFARKYFDTSAKLRRENLKRLYPYLFNSNNEEAVKFSLIYLLAMVFLANNPSVCLPKYFVNLVDNLNDFNNFHWGKLIWDDNIIRLRNQLHT